MSEAQAIIYIQWTDNDGKAKPEPPFIPSFFQKPMYTPRNTEEKAQQAVKTPGVVLSNRRSSDLGDGDSRGPTAVVSLRRDDLVVICAQFHAKIGPCVEVVCGSDCSARALRAADGPVLLEGRGTDDRGLVGACALVDIVGATIRGDGTLVCAAAGGVVRAERFNDVVFDEGILAPAVDGEVAITVGLVVGVEINRPGRSRVPSFSSDKVPVAGPGHAVFTSSSVGVGDSSTPISPEGVVVAVVSTRRARSSTAGEQWGCG